MRRRRVSPTSTDDDKNVSRNDSSEESSPLIIQEQQQPVQEEEQQQLLQASSDDVQSNYKSKSSTSSSFVVAKWLILRSIGFVYFIAFWGAYNQNIGLIGKNGLQPINELMEERLKPTYSTYSIDHNNNKSLWKDGFLSHPTLFWFIPVTDSNMNIFAMIGMILSICVCLGQVNSWFIMFMLWIIDFSIVTISSFQTSFYSYGWESQLLETGFLSIFLCNLPHLLLMITDNTEEENYPEQRNKPQSRSKTTTTKIRIKSLFYDDYDDNNPSQQSSNHILILWLYRWLCYRISIGAGLIKIRGSSCWTNKTCLYYHFETQPIPSPMSFIFHFLPKSLLRSAVDLDLFVQVYTSWFVLLPELPSILLNSNKNNNNNAVLTGINTFLRNIRRVGGYIQIGFMINIILSGNFAFLNHLTIIPALACLDDDCFSLFRWLKQKLVIKNDSKQNKDRTTTTTAERRRIVTILPRWIIDITLTSIIAYLSIPVVSNLLQLGNTRQQMNASFDSFRIVNTYGAFGDVGKARYEPIVYIGTKTTTVTTTGDNNNQYYNWTELNLLPCKPGNVKRIPCFCAPYHYRLDWNIWFIGFKPHQHFLQNRESWLYLLLGKMLDTSTIIASNTIATGDRTSSRALDISETYAEKPWLKLLDNSAANYLLQLYDESLQKQQQTRLYAKVDMYRYEMSMPLWSICYKYVMWLLLRHSSTNSNVGKKEEIIWWRRTFEESLIPPVQLDRSNKKLQLAA